MGLTRIEPYLPGHFECDGCGHLEMIAVKHGQRNAERSGTMRSPLGHHAIMAQRYSDWAQQQIDRSNRTLNPKARNDRLALAEYYLQLAEQELVAAKRLEAAVAPPQIRANTFPVAPRDGSPAAQREGTI
jgi:hypothetical protein